MFRNCVFTIVKLWFLKVGERKTKILNNFLNSIHCFGPFFLATFMDFYLMYFVVVSQNVVYLVLEPLGADFELPSGPSHPRKPSFYDCKTYFLIKRGLWCESALMRDSGPSWDRFGSSWARMGCSFGAFNASLWRLRLPRIPPNVDKSNFMNQTWIFWQFVFVTVKLQFLKVSVAIQISESF